MLTFPPFGHSFPIMGSPQVFYDEALAAVHVLQIPPTAAACPPVATQHLRYNINNRYQPQSLSWSWHNYPYTAPQSNTWIEVLHQADPFGDEHYGCVSIASMVGIISIVVSMTDPF